MKQVFWLYVWPAAVGFLGVVGYQICARTAARGDRRFAVFALAATTAMLSVFGWSTMVRTVRMIPLYGLGVGAGYLTMSRLHGVVVKRNGWIRVPRVIWRGDMKAVDALRRNMMESGPR